MHCENLLSQSLCHKRWSCPDEKHYPHGPDPADSEALKFKNCLKEKAATTHDRHEVLRCEIHQDVLVESALELANRGAN